MSKTAVQCVACLFRTYSIQVPVSVTSLGQVRGLCCGGMPEGRESAGAAALRGPGATRLPGPGQGLPPLQRGCPRRLCECVLQRGTVSGARTRQSGRRLPGDDRIHPRRISRQLASHVQSWISYCAGDSGQVRTSEFFVCCC